MAVQKNIGVVAECGCLQYSTVHFQYSAVPNEAMVLIEGFKIEWTVEGMDALMAAEQREGIRRRRGGIEKSDEIGQFDTQNIVDGKSPKRQSCEKGSDQTSDRTTNVRFLGTGKGGLGHSFLAPIHSLIAK